MVYARRDAQGQELRLGVSGMLWRDGLVMFDRDSKTLWAQVSGEALRGPRDGQKLTPLPSVRTTWAEWVKAHPDTLVLSKEGSIVRSSRYADYHSDPQKLGVLGTRNPDPRLPGKETVVGVSDANHAGAVRKSDLVARGLVETTLGDEPVLLVWRGVANGSAAFGARADGRRLHFTLEPDGRLRDGETGSAWDALTGEGVEGALKGRRLVPLPSLEAYWFAWSAYHPGSTLVDPSK